MTEVELFEKIKDIVPLEIIFNSYLKKMGENNEYDYEKMVYNAHIFLKANIYGDIAKWLRKNAYNEVSNIDKVIRLLIGYYFVKLGTKKYKDGR